MHQENLPNAEPDPPAPSSERELPPVSSDLDTLSLMGKLAAYDERLRQQLHDQQADQAIDSFDPLLTKAVRTLREALTFTEDLDNEDSVEECRLISAGEIGLPERFQIKSKLGSGGYGIVYCAYDHWLHREVAIKILRPELLGNRKLRARFMRESRAAARLNHPCIVRILEASDTQSAAWQVCERVEGTTLSEHIKHSSISLKLAARFARDLADAIAHAHSQKVLHRDIKPENVMVDVLPGESLESANLRLADFGLARLTDIDTTLLSCSGLLVGTPRYMAPEQVMGKVDQHGDGTDIYAVGIVLYEMLTGQNPFYHMQSIQERLSRVTEPVPSVRKSCPAVPLDLATICSKCLEFRAEDRYPTAVELREDIDRYLFGLPTKARPLPINEQLWRWAVRHQAIAATLMILIISVAIIFAQSVQSNLIYRNQNELLRKSNLQLLAEESRAFELANVADGLKREAEAKQLRFEELAWNKGIREAYLAWQHRNYAETKDLMNSLQATHASWKSRVEWRLLRADVDRHVKTLLDLTCAIHEVRAVPNSSFVAAAAANGNVYVIDVATGETQLVIPTGIDSLHALAVSRDGKSLATGGAMHPDLDLAIPKVFDIKTGALLRELPPQETTIESLEFSADNQWLACGTRYKDVQFIEIETGAISTLPASRRNNWLAASPDGKLIAAQVSPRSVLIADFHPPFSWREIEYEHELEVSAWLTGGAELIHAARPNQDTDIFASKANPLEIRLKGTSQSLEFLSISTTADYIVGSLRSGEIFVLPNSDTVSSQSQFISRVSNAPVSSVAVVGDWLLGATHNGELIRQRIPVTKTTTVKNLTDTARSALPSAAAWSPQGEFALIGNEAGEVFKVDTESRFLPEIPLSKFDPTLQGRFNWKIEASPFRQPSTEAKFGLDVEMISEDTGLIESLSIAPDHSTWARGTRGHGLTVMFMDRNGSKTPRTQHIKADDSGDDIGCICYSPDSTKLAWTGNSRKLCVARLLSNRLEHQSYDLPGPGSCLTWSADGSRVAVGGDFPKLLELDFASSQLSVLADYGTSTKSLVCNAKGQIVSGHLDGQIRLFDHSSRSISVLQLHPAAVRHIKVIDSGRIGLSVDVECNVGVWFAHSGERIGLIEHETKPSYGIFTMSPQLWIDANKRLDLLHNNIDASTSVETWDLSVLH